MELEIDFKDVTNVEEMHALLKSTFGFPDFYGMNNAALIDCWSSLADPEDGMSELTISKDDTLVMNIKNFPLENKYVLRSFFNSVRLVNQRRISCNVSAYLVIRLI